MNSDWPERFRALELQEMRYDIQMIECHLPDPWYRVPMCWLITLMMFGGTGVMFLAALCTTTFGPVVFFLVSGILSTACGLGLMWKYDDWFADPCSIILDKKMYRETEIEGSAFSSHSKVNAHRLNTIEAAEKLLEMEHQVESERAEAEKQEVIRFAKLSTEEKIQETLKTVEDRITTAICSGYTMCFVHGQLDELKIRNVRDLNIQDKRDIAYDILYGEGFIAA